MYAVYRTKDKNRLIYDCCTGSHKWLYGFGSFLDQTSRINEKKTY